MTGDSVASMIAASAEGAAWAAEVAGLDGRGQTRAIIRAAADGPCLRLDMRLRCLQVRSLSDYGLTALVTTLPNLHRLGGASRYSDFALVAAHGELVARGRGDVLKSLHAVSGAVSDSVARMLIDPPGERRVAVQFQARSPLSPVTWSGR
jgi:hypothetical protein